MNIFWHEIKQYFRSTIIWAIAISAVATFYLSIYSAFTKDVETVRKILGNYPPAFRAAIGLQLNIFFTLNGFYLFIFGIVVLVAAVQAANFGVGIISKEAAGKTFDFLLSKPITRGKIITSKIAAALTLLVITNIIYIAVVLTAANAVSKGDFEAKKFVLISLTLFLVQLMFFVIGLFLSAIVPKIKSPISVSLPLVFAFYIIGALDTIFGKNIRYLTPFKFYDLTYIIKNGKFETKFLLIEAVFLVVVTGAVYYLYNKKDIPAVD